MGFARFADIDDNKLDRFLWYKTTNTAQNLANYYDTAPYTGVPAANYYASDPKVGAPLLQTKGMRHALCAEDGTEHLVEALVFGGGGTTEAPAQFTLCDYLMYYPFIDGDSPDPQDLENPSPLPRGDGTGVRMMVVSQGAVSAAGASYTISYTNEQGVAGRTSSGVLGTSSSVIGEILTTPGSTGATRFAPFAPLQSGDLGVSSVESITLPSSPGGVMALVLVRPVAAFTYAEIGTPAETTYYPRLPDITGACLNMIQTSSTGVPAARTFTGILTTIRS